jgi:hypothetical protein
VAIIIGALVIIGLLAIVGAVLLLRGGGRDQAVQPVPPAAVAANAPESEASAMPSHASLSVPLSMEDSSESELPTMPLNGSSSVPAAPEVVHAVSTDSLAPQGETTAEESIPEHPEFIEQHVPERITPTERDTEQHIVLNGQFHELVDQLRTLHEQSVEIEQRLNALNKMVERIDQREATNK